MLKYTHIYLKTKQGKESIPFHATAHLKIYCNYIEKNISQKNMILNINKAILILIKLFL